MGGIRSRRVLIGSGSGNGHGGARVDESQGRRSGTGSLKLITVRAPFPGLCTALDGHVSSADWRPVGQQRGEGPKGSPPAASSLPIARRLTAPPRAARAPALHAHRGVAVAE